MHLQRSSQFITTLKVTKMAREGKEFQFCSCQKEARWATKRLQQISNAISLTILLTDMVCNFLLAFVSSALSIKINQNSTMFTKIV